ncbi:MAG: 30S ribosomal protein S18 [Verrucomicrobiota bacterium]|jgi:small subunit ribosomal protein S18|nr:30S ribosomal protein S18 [Kiritimatiellaceae bacterium]MEC7107984.1 30S ribosomal protein S18 [Verrucomicrobiota bacterium]MEC8313852.1 30S ribosomal protein S18 [Verrucomicrobiota bacterium]MEC8517658.1 30S ribosomal protein S18 [Verrucomicrobiota bacterium]MEC8753928.1 30S ribosomal protein S18 [Verrucomicrobiota bacterium]|tara:strand:+ start:1789 stop:2001 length:213 start_codon:yes stop_codon:yes gene_type:complete
MSRKDQDEYRTDPELLKGVTDFDYKDAELLKKFMTDRGKIIPGRLTGASSLQQRRLKKAIRRARIMGLVR